jgi:hypothetical protein
MAPAARSLVHLRAILSLAMVGLACAWCASSVRAQSARVGRGPDALPAVAEVPLSVAATRGIGARVGLGYGLTEAVLGADDTHHRTQLDLAASVTPLPWFAAAIRLLGRYDAHVGGPDDGDDGVITETHLTARADAPLGPAFRFGSELSLWLPGADGVGDAPSALSGDIQLLGSYVPEGSPLTLGAAVGFRVDRSAHAGGDPALFSAADRLALGASDAALAARFGVAMTYRLGGLDLLAEWSWKMYFDYMADSPMWVRAGARYRLSRAFQLEGLFGISPSSRPSLAVGAPLAVVEPRVSAVLAAAIDFPWETADPVDFELRARLDAEQAEKRAQVTVRGQVLNAGGTGVEGALVTLARDAAVEEVRSKSDGAFTFEALAAGSYRLAVAAEGFIAHEEPVELAAGEQRALRVTLKRELPEGQIRGTVRRFNGAPVRAEIVIKSLAIKQENADDGSFEINVPPGDYDVLVKARGFKDQTRRARVEDNGVAILIVELEPKKR